MRARCDPFGFDSGSQQLPASCSGPHAYWWWRSLYDSLIALMALTSLLARKSGTKVTLRSYAVAQRRSGPRCETLCILPRLRSGMRSSPNHIPEFGMGCHHGDACRRKNDHRERHRGCPDRWRSPHWPDCIFARAPCARGRSEGSVGQRAGEQVADHLTISSLPMR